jgi:hypothetical protein
VHDLVHARVHGVAEVRAVDDVRRHAQASSVRTFDDPGVDAQTADTGMGPGFEVAPDGRLVALMAPPGSLPSPRASHVTLVLNFFSEVKRRTSQ